MISIFFLETYLLTGISDATAVLSLRICNEESKFEGNSENKEEVDEEILIKCHFAQIDMKMADSEIASWIFVANSISKASIIHGLKFLQKKYYLKSHLMQLFFLNTIISQSFFFLNVLQCCQLFIFCY